jgi:uncharacterized protein YkwD
MGQIATFFQAAIAAVLSLLSVNIVSPHYAPVITDQSLSPTMAIAQVLSESLIATEEASPSSPLEDFILPTLKPTNTPTPTPTKIASKSTKILRPFSSSLSEHISPTPKINQVFATPTPTHKPSPTPTIKPKPFSTPTPTKQPQLISAETTPIPATPNSLSGDYIFTKVNEHRESKNLKPLIKDEQLCRLATIRSTEIENEIFVTKNMHSGLYNRNLPYFITENIAYYQTEDASIAFWLRDYIHRITIEGNYTYSCAACSGKYCSQLFTNYTPK